MELKTFTDFMDAHGGIYAGCVLFGWVSWKLGNELLQVYRTRIALADDRDEKHVKAMENIAVTMKTMSEDNRQLNQLLLNSCKYRKEG